MDVNYLGAAQCAHAVVTGMKGRREGSIVFVSSQAGFCGIYGFGAYSASKFALRGLAEALSMEVILNTHSFFFAISDDPRLKFFSWLLIMCR